LLPEIFRCRSGRRTTSNEELLFHPLSEWTGGELLTEDELAELIGSVSDKNSQYGLGVSLSTAIFGVGYGHAGEFPGYRTGALRKFCDFAGIELDWIEPCLHRS
jgi:hypothetical protein